MPPIAAAKRDLHFRKKLKTKRSLRLVGAFECPLPETERVVMISQNRGFATVDYYFTSNRALHATRFFSEGRGSTPFMWGSEFLSASINAIKALKEIHDSGYVHGGITRDSLLLRWNYRPEGVSAIIRGFFNMRRHTKLPKGMADDMHPMYITGTREKDAFDLFLVLMEMHGFYTKAMQDFRATLLATDQYLLSTAPRRSKDDMLSTWDEYHLSTMHTVPPYHLSCSHAESILTDWLSVGRTQLCTDRPTSLVPYTKLDLRGVIKSLSKKVRLREQHLTYATLDKSYAFAEMGLLQGSVGQQYSFWNFDWVRHTAAAMVRAIENSRSGDPNIRQSAFSVYPKKDILVIGQHLCDIPLHGKGMIMSNDEERKVLLQYQLTIDRFISEHDRS